MGQSARVTWPFLYFPGDRLSQTELMAARLDGHVVEIGEAFMPADAVETREMRAGSLRSILGSQLAATHESAAWVHGVRDEPPSRHQVQRCVDHRVAHVLDTRLHYRDLRLPPRDCVVIGGVTVSSIPRTFADLVREHVSARGDERIVKAFVQWMPSVVDQAIAWFDEAGPVHFKRPALEYLRRNATMTT